MKHAFFACLAIALSTPAGAATIDAGAGSTFVSTFRVNDGSALPAGIVAVSSGPASAITVEGSLDAPDAVNTVTTVNEVAGTSADNPSVFGIRDQTTRAGSPDIVVSQNRDYLHGILVLSPEPPNDFVERGHRGFGATDAILFSDDPVQANGLVDVSRSRDVAFENLTGQDYFFTLTGRMELSARAEFNGADGFAAAFTSMALIFASTDSLDISFAPLTPYLPNTVMTGDSAVAQVDRSVDVSGTGILGLSASARVQGTDPAGEELALAFGAFDYVLGVTLKPGEVLTMRHTVSYRDEVDALHPPAPVPLPAGLPLLGAALALMALHGPGRRFRAA